MARKNEGFLAEFELYVMLAIARLGRDAFGAAIRREIEERTGRPVSIGAVYATLGRMSDQGLLDHHLTEPQPVRGGRSKKIYTFTDAGAEALSTSARMLRRMMEGAPIPEGDGV